MADQDIPPASTDDAVQNFLDVKWRDAMRACREGMEGLRELWPEFVEHLPETGSSALSRALADFESAYSQLHRAGRHVLGQEEYDRYLEAVAQRKVG